MSDAKKDLTGLMDFAKTLEGAGESSASSDSLAMPAMEAPELEKFDSFESLEEYGKNQPEVAAPAMDAVPGLDAAPAMEMAVTLDTPSEMVLETPSPTPTFETAPPSFEPAPTLEPLEKIKQYSESLSPAKDAVPAAFPFSLIITGRLAPEERERLLDLLSRENMGVREMDLEPQFESGKILIPRISEYAAILLVGALRSAQVQMKLGPSDTIFSTEDTQDTHGQGVDTGARISSVQSDSSDVPAEKIPVTPSDQMPGLGQYVVIDVVTASAALHSTAVEAKHTSEYSDLIEALTREIKHKAFRKGATAVLNFHVQLTSLHLPSQYRVLVTGSAVKARL